MFDWISDWISFNPSGSRWAIFALGIGFALFFLGSCGMLPIDSKQHPKIAKIFLGLGIFFLVGTIALSCYWVATGPKDTTASTHDIQRIEEKLNDVENRLDQQNGILNQKISNLTESINNLTIELRGGSNGNTDTKQ